MHRTTDTEQQTQNERDRDAKKQACRTVSIQATPAYAYAHWCAKNYALTQTAHQRMCRQRAIQSS